MLTQDALLPQNLTMLFAVGVLDLAAIAALAAFGINGGVPSGLKRLFMSRSISVSPPLSRRVLEEWRKWN